MATVKPIETGKNDAWQLVEECIRADRPFVFIALEGEDTHCYINARTLGERHRLLGALLEWMLEVGMRRAGFVREEEG